MDMGQLKIGLGGGKKDRWARADGGKDSWREITGARAETDWHALVEVQMSRFNPIHSKCAFPPGYSQVLPW